MVVTTYFCSKSNPQTSLPPVKKDDYPYISLWYDSMNEKLDGIIFYDNLSDDFIKTYENNFIKFVRVNPAAILGSLNDERFKIYLKF